MHLAPSSLREATLRQARAIAARAAGGGPVRSLPARGKAKVIVAEADGTMLPIVTTQATAKSVALCPNSKPSKSVRAPRCSRGWRRPASPCKCLTKRPRCAAPNATSPTARNSLTTPPPWPQTYPSAADSLEAGHRHVLHARLKVSGAWWQRDNAEAMIQARVCRANGQWAASWKTSRPRKQPATLKPPKPTPRF